MKWESNLRNLLAMRQYYSELVISPIKRKYRDTHALIPKNNGGNDIRAVVPCAYRAWLLFEKGQEELEAHFDIDNFYN